jgi:hypothetical protein
MTTRAFRRVGSALSGTRSIADTRAEEEWALHVQEEGGLSIPGDGELFSTRAEAVLAGALRALSGGQRNPLT